MPRHARLDIPGLLQHVIVRGIERRDIFLDDQDRQSFIDRFSTLLHKTNTECLAWALMTNHFHLLLYPRQVKLAIFMRRLLTGHAVTFNQRHRRAGHLFQNRYKSIVCEEEPYLLELVRYIHLNPLRAGLVKGMPELDHYPWSGHAALMGNSAFVGQQTEEVLARFGRRQKDSRQKYRTFVQDGIAQGKRGELVGGGLQRSLKGAGIAEEEFFDERVLGSGDFVENLRQEQELAKRLPVATTLPEMIKQVAAVFGIKPEALSQRNRSKQIADARSVLCYFMVREIGHNGAEIARALRISRAGVSMAARRGEVIIQNEPSLRKQLMG